MVLKSGLLLAFALGAPLLAHGQVGAADLLRAVHSSLQLQLGQNQVNRPVVLVSTETPEALSDATRVNFDYRVLAATPDYLAIALDAREGPMGTSNFRIKFEALALPDGKSFIHLPYWYQMNFGARLAMSSYLGTVARNKSGFTVVGQADGQNQYIGGLRGLMERNTMRYFLAINAFLEAATAPPGAQLERRLQNWFAAVEQYPRQLHEMERQEYLTMKRAENERQQSAP